MKFMTHHSWARSPHPSIVPISNSFLFNHHRFLKILLRKIYSQRLTLLVRSRTSLSFGTNKVVFTEDARLLHFGPQQTPNRHKKLFMTNLHFPVHGEKHRSSQQNHQVGTNCTSEMLSSFMFVLHITS